MQNETNKTLNNIVDKIADLADKHPMINDNGNGHTADIGTDRKTGKELVYPYVWTDYKDTRYILSKNARGISHKLYSLQVMVLDKYTPNAKNSQEVMSDTEGILSDIIQELANNRTLARFGIEFTSLTAVPVRDDEKDGVEGWLCPIAFKIPYSFCHKNLPFPNGN